MHDATEKDSRCLILALGDSTTAGTPGFKSPIEAPPDGSGNVESQYPYWLMQTHPDWCMLSRGVNGERTDDILARLAREFIRFTPDLVMIIAGVNDIYQGRPADIVRRKLEAIYAAAKRAPSHRRWEHPPLQHRHRGRERPDACRQ